MISARDLTKKFGNITALSQLKFDISPGEFVFLTGPSGSGKTTLLRLVLREFKPDQGSLVVEGQDIGKIPLKKLPQYRRTIGPIFQDYKLLSDLDVAENVALPLHVRGLKPQDVDKAVKLALEMVDLIPRAHLFPSQLSGGELQRVAIARAIVIKPKLILADEPTGNLDPKAGRAIVKLLKDIHSELKTTIVMATHNADIVNNFTSRVISLAAGKIVGDNPKGKYES